jgi:hypothetical protein
LSAAAVVLTVVAATLRHGGSGDGERNREYSKELCHTKSAWLTILLP